MYECVLCRLLKSTVLREGFFQFVCVCICELNVLCLCVFIYIYSYDGRSNDTKIIIAEAATTQMVLCDSSSPGRTQKI